MWPLWKRGLEGQTLPHRIIGGSFIFRTRQRSRPSHPTEGREQPSPDNSSPGSSKSEGLSKSSHRTTNFPSRLDLGRNNGESSNPNPFEGLALGTVPLGKDWALDIVGLPHNAARREIKGLYYCLDGIENGNGAIRSEARVWFAWFADFIECVFAMEEGVTFAWLRQAGADLPEVMSTTRRAVKCGRARAICKEIDEALQSSGRIRAMVDRLANVVLSHFGMVESVVPQVLRSVFEASARNHAIEVMASSLAKTRPELFMLLARGFDDDILQQNFVRVYGRKADRVAFMNRVMQFEKRHIAIVYNIVQQA